MLARRIFAKSSASVATCGTPCVTPIHFIESSVLYRKWGLSCDCIIRIRVSFSSFWRSTERLRFSSHSSTIRLKPTASCPSSSPPCGTTRALNSPICTRFIAAVISRTGRVTWRLSTSAPHRHSIRLTAPSVTPRIAPPAASVISP